MRNLSLRLATVVALLAMVIVPIFGEAEMMIEEVVMDRHDECTPLGGYCDRRNPRCCGTDICLGYPGRCERRCHPIGSHCDRRNPMCCGDAVCIGYPGRCELVN